MSLRFAFICLILILIRDNKINRFIHILKDKMKSISEVAANSTTVVADRTELSINQAQGKLSACNITPEALKSIGESKSITNKIVDRVKANVVGSVQMAKHDLGGWEPAEQNPFEVIYHQAIISIVNRSVQTLQNRVACSISSLQQHFSSMVVEDEQKPQKQAKSGTDSLPQVITKSMRTINRTERLFQIEQEKKNILQQLEDVDQKIIQIRGLQRTKSLTKKRQSRLQQFHARENAKRLVQQYKIQKTIKQKKRRTKTEQILDNIKKEEQQFRMYKQKHEQQSRQDRRRVIEDRMRESKKKREERVSIERESSKLVAHLKQQDDLLKKKIKIPQMILQVQHKKASINDKKQDINFKEIQKHQRSYIQDKYRKQKQSRSRVASINHPTCKFQKNIWASILEEEEIKRKNEQKLKEISPKIMFDKRIKYGELVKSIFAVNQKERVTKSRERLLDKPTTPDPKQSEDSDSLALPKISESDKRINDSKLIRKYRQNRRLVTSPGGANVYQNKVDKSPEDTQKDVQRELRLIELRKKTEERLKIIDNYQPHAKVDERPKYRNYLGTVKVKRRENPQEWKKIIENSSLTQDEKCSRMLKKVGEMQQKARKREMVRTEAQDKVSIDLYINSIQAKLAILQEM